LVLQTISELIKKPDLIILSYHDNQLHTCPLPSCLLTH